jgi:hypothetical protein
MWYWDSTLWVNVQYELFGIRFIVKVYEFMNASFGYGSKKLQPRFNKRSRGKSDWSFSLFKIWTSLHEKLSCAQCLIGFSKPLCVPIMLWIQKGLVFVSIVLCILDMDELEMLNFLEDEFHIVRTFGLGS